MGVGGREAMKFFLIFQEFTLHYFIHGKHVIISLWLHIAISPSQNQVRGCIVIVQIEVYLHALTIDTKHCLAC